MAVPHDHESYRADAHTGSAASCEREFPSAALLISIPAAFILFFACSAAVLTAAGSKTE